MYLTFDCTLTHLQRIFSAPDHFAFVILLTADMSEMKKKQAYAGDYVAMFLIVRPI